MDRRVKIGFVGCGAFCSGTHIPNAARNPGFELVAFCDLNPERLQPLREQYAPAYVTQDMEELFHDPAIEAVICGTKPDFRLPIMELAVRHRKHLFVEKPLCWGRDELGEMLALMGRAPSLFMVGFNRPYSPMMQDIKPLYQAMGSGNALIVYRIIGEAQLWPASHQEAVLIRKESTLIHEATHIFDLLNWLTDLEPVRVHTIGAGNTDNIISLTYPDDVYAVIVAGDNSTAGFPKERIEINRGFSTIVGEDFVEVRTAGVQNEALLKTYPFTQEGRACDGGCAEAARRYWAWRKSVTPEEREYGYYYDRMPRVNKGHYGELEHFRRCIIDHRPPETGIRRGALANLIADSAVASWGKGVPVDLDLAVLV